MPNESSRVKVDEEQQRRISVQGRKPDAVTIETFELVERRCHCESQRRRLIRDASGTSHQSFIPDDRTVIVQIVNRVIRNTNLVRAQ